MSISAYYQLTKPGIIYGNLLVAAAGYVFADTPFDIAGFFAMLLGLACIIASGCVINNYFDRELDAKMERTKGRAMVTGAVDGAHALVFAAILGALGVFLLWYFTNPLTLGAAAGAALVYTCIYTPMKPRTPYAVFVGAIAGAAPPVVGYAAAANMLDAKALFLFGFLFVWQIPHFLAIATYRYAEYAAAGVPLFIKKEPSADAKRLGRKVFLYSLVVLLAFCGALLFV